MYTSVILPHFIRQLQGYNKKYRHLGNAVADTLDDFHKEQHARLRGNMYKVRLRTKDMARGKSSAFRLIVLIIEINNYIIPVTIYFKGERAGITKKELSRHLEIILFELRTR